MPIWINDTIYQTFAGNRIFVIPTFQRPYAWDDDQWQDVEDDIRDAVQRPHPFHYFAPIHVVHVTGRQQQIWQDYQDKNNRDLIEIATAGFRDQHGTIETLMVIDGQQRLVTLYVLLCAAQGAPLFLTLPNGLQVPKVILSPADDHAYFRALLWPANQPMPQQVARSQDRLHRLFQFAGAYANPRFPANSPEYAFLTGQDCKTLLIELPAGPQLSSFMTLNDRGKDLSLLEKTKALLMGFDANGIPPNPAPINNAFSDAYLSLDQNLAYLGDNEFLRQVGWAIWGCCVNARIFEKGVESIYADDFRNPGQYHGNVPPAHAVHAALLPRLINTTLRHNDFVAYLNQAQIPKPVGFPSFVTALLPNVMRDAIEDYHAVLNDLRLTARQIGFLFQIRNTLGCEWHDSIGTATVANVNTINTLTHELGNILNEIKQNIQGNEARILLAAHNAIAQEVNALPPQTQRTVTPLYLAELLKIIVNQNKPGGFDNAWRWTFCRPNPAGQQCCDVWMDYITSFRSRDRFIVGILARTDVNNNTEWLGYLLREHECWLAGNVNARRLPDWEIEHFFPINPGFPLGLAGFGDLLAYQQGFLEQVGNKLVLDTGLNRALRNHNPLAKLPSYLNQAYQNVVVPPGKVSHSAQQVAADLNGVGTLNAVRLYVKLRAVRLAAFAVLRF